MNKRRILVGAVGLVLVAAFTLFSWAVRKGAFRQADFAVTVKVQDAVDRSVHLRTSAFIGDFLEGSVGLASPGLVSLAVIIITGWQMYRGRGWKGRLVPLIIPLLFFCLTAAEVFGKTVVHHPSPPFMFLKNPTSHFPEHYSVEEYSYPSGHAARAVFLAVIVLTVIVCKQWNNITMRQLRTKRYYLPVLLGLFYIGAVSVSVIYLGHHWISDVVGGWFIGCGLGLLGVSFLPKR